MSVSVREEDFLRSLPRTSGLPPWHQWTLWTRGILLPCMSGSSLLVCMALYRWPRRVPLNIWPVLQNRSLLLLGKVLLKMGHFGALRTPLLLVPVKFDTFLRVLMANWTVTALTECNMCLK